MFEPQPFHLRRPGLVAPVRADPYGERGPTRGQARGPDWRTTSRGLFVPAAIELTPEQRIVEAAAVLKSGEAVTGWAALRWRGGSWFTGTTARGQLLDVPLVARRHRAAQHGLSISQDFLHPDEVEVVDGVPVTAASRSVMFETRFASTLGEAIIALDMACFNDLVSVAEMAACVGAAGPITGIQQARDALVEAEENSWSPRETAMRGLWTRGAGLPRPLCNHPVFDLAGRHLGTADLIDPETGLIGEYNGAVHLVGAQVAKDLRREAAFRDVGMETITMVAEDWRDQGDFCRRLQAARARAAGRSERGWTLVPPPWWTPTATVAQRRALDVDQRERFLRHRGAA